jgi:hypothetical protein
VAWNTEPRCGPCKQQEIHQRKERLSGARGWNTSRGESPEAWTEDLSTKSTRFKTGGNQKSKSGDGNEIEKQAQTGGNQISSLLHTMPHMSPAHHETNKRDSPNEIKIKEK